MANRPNITTIAAGKYSVSVLNANFQALRDAFDNVLGTNGTSGSNNDMSGDLNMNGNVIRNATFDGDVIGLEWQGAWLTATDYEVNDLVSESGNVYICVVDHLSGTFATDLAAAKWEVFAAAPDGLTASAFAETLLDDADAATARATLGVYSTAEVDSAVAAVSSGGLPVGLVLPYAGATAPTDFLLCYGQAVSRVTYSALFGIIGTVYGAGDGSTTFNLPDLRGRVVAGQDDMGGTSANRLTGTIAGGIDGDPLGQTGGSESCTQTTDTLPAHTHSASGMTTDTGGAHSHNVVNEAGADEGVLGITIGSGNNAGSTSGYIVSGGSHSHNVSGSITSTGSGDPHNIVQPTIILNYIIYAGA